MSDNDQPLTAVVEMQVRTETTSRDQWLDEWQKRAQDAYEHEPETLAYEAAVSVEDESRVLVIERYLHGRSSLQKHIVRPAHKLLEENMSARRMTKRRVFANGGVDIPDFGWWARKEFAPEVRTAGYPLTLLSMRFAQSVQRDRFIELSGEHARYCHKEEPETLVYSGMIATNDAKPDSPFANGDLLFVMACTDDAAVEKHALDPNHIAMGEKFMAEGIEFVHTEGFQYRTSGRGFLWR